MICSILVRKFFGLLLAFAVLTSAHLATASGVLDQSAPSGFGQFYKPNLWQQGVTAGLTGQLTQIDIDFLTTQAVELTLYDGSPWNAGVATHTQIFSANTIGLGSIDVSAANFMVTAGSTFTIGLRGFGANTPMFRGNISNTYPDGILYVNGDVGGLGNPAEGLYDMTFNTYVNPIPEPASLCLALFGTVATVLRRRAR